MEKLSYPTRGQATRDLRGAVKNTDPSHKDRWNRMTIASHFQENIDSISTLKSNQIN